MQLYSMSQILDRYTGYLGTQPRRRVVVIQSVSGMYAALYYSPSTCGETSGVAIQYDRPDVSTILTGGDEPRWKIIDSEDGSWGRWQSKFKMCTCCK